MGIKAAVAVLSVILTGSGALTGCGGTNQALLASGGARDFAAMNRVAEEYGGGGPLATVPVMVGSDPYTFNVWISKSGNQIMVQTAALGAVATTAFFRGLTAGLADTRPEYEPFQEAAATYLATSYGPGCTLVNSRSLTNIGFEWDFACLKPPGAPLAPQRQHRRPRA